MDYTQLPSAKIEYDPVYGEVLIVDNEDFKSNFEIYVSKFEKTAAASKIQLWWRMKFKF